MAPPTKRQMDLFNLGARTDLMRLDVNADKETVERYLTDNENSIDKAVAAYCHDVKRWNSLYGVQDDDGDQIMADAAEDVDVPPDVEE